MTHLCNRYDRCHLRGKRQKWISGSIKWHSSPYCHSQVVALWCMRLADSPGCCSHCWSSKIRWWKWNRPTRSIIKMTYLMPARSTSSITTSINCPSALPRSRPPAWLLPLQPPSADIFTSIISLCVPKPSHSGFVSKTSSFLRWLPTL